MPIGLMHITHSAPRTSLLCRVKGLGARYNHFLKAKPIITKAITSGVLMGCADVLAQTIGSKEDHQRKLDLKRVALHVVFGAGFVGPLGHYHFLFLDRTAALLGMTSGAWIYKLFMAQFVYWSWGLNGSYLGFMALCNGKDANGARQEVCDKIMGVQQRNWVFWLPVASICFKAVPVPLQLTYTLSMNVVWQTFLSWFNNLRPEGNDVEIRFVENPERYTRTLNLN